MVEEALGRGVSGGAGESPLREAGSEAVGSEVEVRKPLRVGFVATEEGGCVGGGWS